jgi:p-hydroxybenzoic acid efflux pump subunit AaeB
VWQAKELFAAVVVGVLVADVVNWLAGVEGDVRIRLGEAPLWPIRAEWINQSVMLSVTVLLTLIAAHVVNLPPEKAAVSVLVLTITPHLQALIQKGELRVAGLVLATIWSLATFLIVGLLPYFPLLAGLLFLGQFVATYLTLTTGKYAYAGLQMGLVLPMVVVAEPPEFGSITPAVERLGGIVLGLGASIVVAGLWPRFPLAESPPMPPASAVAIPGEMDV